MSKEDSTVPFDGMNRRSFIAATALLPQLVHPKRASASGAACNALPPQDLTAEQGVLGALLDDNASYGHLSFLSAEHFADPVHGVIYAATVEKILAGKTADLAAIRAHFEGSRVLLEVGGASYLDQLSRCAAEDVAEEGRTIYAMWRQREAE